MNAALKATPKATPKATRFLPVFRLGRTNKHEAAAMKKQRASRASRRTEALRSSREQGNASKRQKTRAETATRIANSYKRIEARVQQANPALAEMIGPVCDAVWDLAGHQVIGGAACDPQSGKHTTPPKDTDQENLHDEQELADGRVAKIFRQKNKIPVSMVVVTTKVLLKLLLTTDCVQIEWGWSEWAQKYFANFFWVGTDEEAAFWFGGRATTEFFMEMSRNGKPVCSYAVNSGEYKAGRFDGLHYQLSALLSMRIDGFFRGPAGRTFETFLEGFLTAPEDDEWGLRFH